jgi:hypothetical protein
MRILPVLILLLFLTACIPLPLDNLLDPTAPPAVAPTVTPTRTPAPTATPSPTPTPSADAVAADIVSLHEGPGGHLPSVAESYQGDELEVITRTRNCTWLEVRTPAGETGWVLNKPGEIILNLPCNAIPLLATAAFSNGEILVDKRGGVGLFELYLGISNHGSPNDAIIVLTTLDDRPYYACYVEANGTAVLGDMFAGEYNLFVAIGRDWDPRFNVFTENAYYLKAEKPIRIDLVYIFRRDIMRYWYASLNIPGPVYNYNKDSPIHPYRGLFVDGSDITQIPLVTLPPEDFPVLEKYSP